MDSWRHAHTYISTVKPILKPSKAPRRKHGGRLVSARRWHRQRRREFQRKNGWLEGQIVLKWSVCGLQP